MTKEFALQILRLLSGLEAAYMGKDIPDYLLENLCDIVAKLSEIILEYSK